MEPLEDYSKYEKHYSDNQFWDKVRKVARAGARNGLCIIDADFAGHLVGTRVDPRAVDHDRRKVRHGICRRNGGGEQQYVHYAFFPPHARVLDVMGTARIPTMTAARQRLVFTGLSGYRPRMA